MVVCNGQLAVIGNQYKLFVIESIYFNNYWVQNLIYHFTANGLTITDHPITDYQSFINCQLPTTIFSAQLRKVSTVTFYYTKPVNCRTGLP